MAAALTLTLIFLSGSWEVRVARLFCLAVEAGCGERVWFFGLCGLLLKRFTDGGSRVGGFGW